LARCSATVRSPTRSSSSPRAQRNAITVRVRSEIAAPSTTKVADVTPMKRWRTSRFSWSVARWNGPTPYTVAVTAMAITPRRVDTVPRTP
jgi:hypothetical protein